MGLLLSILISYVGAVELFYIVKNVTHFICAHDRYQQQCCNDPNDLSVIQSDVREALAAARAKESIHWMQDGVQYDNGYRVGKRDTVNENRWMEMRRRLSDDENSESARAKKNSDKPLNLDENYLSENKTNLEQTISSVDIDPPTVSKNEILLTKPDSNESDISDDYLRSLDGIKHRPLVREDGSGRRRAFKKRRSSENTAIDPESLKALREDELRLLSTLEQQEQESNSVNDFERIKYTTNMSEDINKGVTHQKMKASPDRVISNSHRSSIDHESPDQWGDVKPQHFKDSELWRRERTMSIEEENELEREEDKEHKRFIPHMTSFEEATTEDHKLAIDAINQQNSDNILVSMLYIHSCIILIL